MSTGKKIAVFIFGLIGLLMALQDPWRALGLLVWGLFLYWLFAALGYGFRQMALLHELRKHKNEGASPAVAVAVEKNITIKESPPSATVIGTSGADKQP